MAREDARLTCARPREIVIALATLGVLTQNSPAVEPGKVDFLREVRPILANHCFKCHGQDEAARKAKLRLDVRDVAVQPAKSGVVPIVPGKPDKSELVRRIFAQDDDQMPPSAAKRPLTQEQKEMRSGGLPKERIQTAWAFSNRRNHRAQRATKRGHERD
jgi:hypothetical protein